MSPIEIHKGYLADDKKMITAYIKTGISTGDWSMVIRYYRQDSEAIGQLESKISKVMGKDGVKKVNSIAIDVYGFSRGAAAVRHLYTLYSSSLLCNNGFRKCLLRPARLYGL